MAKRQGLRAELGGEAIYGWICGEHLRDIKNASQVQDGGRAYHAAVNEFLSFVAGDIGYYTPAWEEWQTKNLRDANGGPLPPNARLSKVHRRREVAHAVAILRNMGVLGYKKTAFSNDASKLKKVLASRGAALDDEPIPDEDFDDEQ